MILSTVISRLVTTFAAATDVPVYDTIPKLHKGRFVVVGGSGTDEDGASVALEPSATGPGTWRDELGEVICSTWAHHGGIDIAARRDEALALAEACISAVHQDRTLGGALTVPTTTSALSYGATREASGSLAWVTFTVTYAALLTT